MAIKKKTQQQIQHQPMVEILAQIKSEKRQPKFVAGIVLHDDVVVEAAPIVGYMKKDKWTRTDVREYCKKRGWEVQVIHRQEL